MSEEKRRLTVVLSDAEYQTIEAAARAASLPVSSWLRWYVLDRLRRDAVIVER